MRGFTVPASVDRETAGQMWWQHASAAVTEGCCPYDSARLTPVSGSSWSACTVCEWYWPVCTRHPQEHWHLSASRSVTVERWGVLEWVPPELDECPAWTP